MKYFGDDFYDVMRDLDQTAMWASKLPDTDPRIIFIQEYAKRRENEVREERENSPEVQEIMKLRFLCGWSINEIADEYGKSKWAVERIISKTKRFFVLNVKTRQLKKFKKLDEAANFLGIEKRKAEYQVKANTLINKCWVMFNHKQWLNKGEEMYEHLRK
ncbi:MAG: hypothetical protein ABF991_00240 [Liquorilactobacillus hordei]|uniref:hypothetical protein n=1 Tax=Liquorilactobacillus hordei TaxID=468911 RepID=UPI0039E74D90